MNLTTASSILFMDKIKRERTIKDIEGFTDMVNESGKIVIFEDYENHQLDYVKENVIKEIQNIGDTPQEKAYLKGIAGKVLSNFVSLDTVSEGYQRVMRLSPAKLEALVSVLLRIEEQRMLANPSKESQEKLKSTVIALDLLNACINIIIEEEDDFNYLEMALEAVVSLCNNKKVPMFHHIINFKIAELVELLQDSNSPYYEQILDIVKGSRIMNESQALSLVTLTNFISGAKVKDLKSIEYLTREKNKLESQIDIILSDNDINKERRVIPTHILDSSKFTIIPTMINHLKEGLDLERLKTNIIGKRPFVCSVRDETLFRIKNVRPKWQFEKCDIGDETIWLATDFVDLHLLLEDTITSDVIIVQLAKNCIMTQELEVLLGCDCTTPEKLKVTRIKFRESNTLNYDIESVSEGITFTEDGGFKLTYTRGSSYMDDYSKINRVLVQNARNKNYEAMKSDLLFLFAFINELESILKGKGKLKDSVREDAMKARAFAKGDFKQYLAIVQTADPQFNFSKYFEENYVNKDKVLVEFSNAEVKGFKKLLRTIIG